MFINERKTNEMKRKRNQISMLNQKRNTLKVFKV